MDQASEHFEVVGSRGFLRLRGEMTLAAGVDLVLAAIQTARRMGLRDLLVDAADLSGFRSPNLGQRYFLMQKWAEAAGGAVHVAMVLRAELIDPGRFGVSVGENLGMVNNVFETEAAALAWLDSLSG